MSSFKSTAPVVKRAYSVPEFCQAYGLGRTLAYEMMLDGRLRFVKVGDRRLIPVDAAEALLAA